MTYEDHVNDHMDRLTVAAEALIAAWSDIQVRGHLKEHPDLVLHDLELIADMVRKVRAKAKREKVGWGELKADPHEDFEDRLAYYQAHTCDCDHCYKADR